MHAIVREKVLDLPYFRSTTFNFASFRQQTPFRPCSISIAINMGSLDIHHFPDPPACQADHRSSFNTLSIVCKSQHLCSRFLISPRWLLEAKSLFEKVFCSFVILSNWIQNRTRFSPYWTTLKQRLILEWGREVRHFHITCASYSDSLALIQQYAGTKQAVQRLRESYRLRSEPPIGAADEPSKRVCLIFEICVLFGPMSTMEAASALTTTLSVTARWI